MFARGLLHTLALVLVGVTNVHATESLDDLPIHEVAARDPERTTLALHLTGDGGYGVTDKGIADGLAQHGIPTVVLNSLHYFWKERTPDGTAADVTRILRYYLAAWKKDDVVLIGYSLGADVLPFVVARLPAELRNKVRVVVLLGLAEQAAFEVDFVSWLGRRPKTYPVLPEIEKLRGLRMVCFYGTEDKDAVAPKLDSKLAKVIAVHSGHRFGSNYQQMVQTILQETAANR